MKAPAIETAAANLQAALDALTETQVAAALEALSAVEHAKGRLTAAIESAEAEARHEPAPSNAIDPDLVGDAGAVGREGGR